MSHQLLLATNQIALIKNGRTRAQDFSSLPGTSACTHARIPLQCLY
jgi:hypothetical protein